MIGYFLKRGFSMEKISISRIQRRFHLGFNKAADYMDQLEADGIVGPDTGSSKPRQVLKKNDE